VPPARGGDSGLCGLGAGSLPKRSSGIALSLLLLAGGDAARSEW
jgi:hypothetical protein